MSWDFVVFAADTPMNTDEEGAAIFPNDWAPSAIGTLTDIRRNLSAMFPTLNWSDTPNGVLTGDDFALEFLLETSETVTSFSIYARGNATQTLLQIIRDTNWRLLEIASSEWLNLAQDPDKGRRQFQEYLNTVAKTHYPPAKRGLFARLLGRQ